MIENALIKTLHIMAYGEAALFMSITNLSVTDLEMQNFHKRLKSRTLISQSASSCWSVRCGSGGGAAGACLGGQCHHHSVLKGGTAGTHVGGRGCHYVRQLQLRQGTHVERKVSAYSVWLIIF